MDDVTSTGKCRFWPGRTDNLRPGAGRISADGPGQASRIRTVHLPTRLDRLGVGYDVPRPGQARRSERARIRLAPEKDWEVNDPAQIEDILRSQEALQADFNGARSGASGSLYWRFRCGLGGSRNERVDHAMSEHLVGPKRMRLAIAKLNSPIGGSTMGRHVVCFSVSAFVASLAFAIPPPLAIDDLVTVADEPVVIDVLANDPIRELDMDRSVSIESRPFLGIAVVQRDNRILYTPPRLEDVERPNADAFSYRVGSSRARVHIDLAEAGGPSCCLTPFLDVDLRFGPWSVSAERVDPFDWVMRVNVSAELWEVVGSSPLDEPVEIGLACPELRGNKGSRHLGITAPNAAEEEHGGEILRGTSIVYRVGNGPRQVVEANRDGEGETLIANDARKVISDMLRGEQVGDSVMRVEVAFADDALEWSYFGKVDLEGLGIALEAAARYGCTSGSH